MCTLYVRTDEESIRLMLAKKFFDGCFNIDGIFEWDLLENYIPGRTASKCRERFVHVLNPEANWDPLSKKEITNLCRL